VPHQRLRAPDRGLEPRAEHEIDGRFGDRLERLVLQVRSVVDDGVDAAAALREVGGHRRKRCLTPDVAGEAMSLPACRFDLGRRVGGARAVDVGHADDGAAAGKVQRDGPPEPAPRAGDQHDLVGEIR
jgi:hypothetical protein